MSTHRLDPAEVTGPNAPPCHPAGELTATADHSGAGSGGAIEMEIIRLEEGGLAMARASAGVAEISIALVAVQEGDNVLVHAGEAVAVV